MACKKGKKKRNLTAIVKRSQSFLPEVKPMTSIAHREVQRAFHVQEEDVCYGQVLRRYSDQKKDKPQKEALVRSRHEIMKVHGVDSLEEVRKAMGLDKYREDLTQAIADNISFDDGLKKVLSHINRTKLGILKMLGRRKAKSIADVGNVMPDISSSEIAWLSAVKNIPGVYLDDSHGVPTILDFNMDGIEFGFDGLNSFELRRAFSQDAYNEAGITGKREDSVIVPYKKDFKKAFGELALLILSDAIIYKNLLKENGDHCLVSGDGKLKKGLLRRQCGEWGLSEEEFDSRRLEDLLSDHDNNLTRARLREVETSINEVLGNKVLYDLGRECFLSDREMVRMIGLLSRVPSVFLDKSEFSGYILPFGRGVKIIDDAGNIVDYSHFEPYLKLAAQEHLYYTMKDTSRDNEMLSFMFDSYAQSVEAEVPLQEDLPLDEAIKKLKSKYGITLHPRSVKSIRTYDPRFAEFELWGTKGAKNLVDYTLKVGSIEALCLLEQLDQLPRKMVPDIKAIKRAYSSVSDFELFLGGTVKLGQLVNGTIYLYSPEDTPFKEFDEVQMQIFVDTLQHELAHGIWDLLTREEMVDWMNIAPKDIDVLTAEEKDRDFLINIDMIRQIYTIPDEDRKALEESGYDVELGDFANMVQEEFCDTFAAYVNHGDEFRHRAEKSEKLQAKYDYFKSLFSARADKGGKIEYSGEPLASIDQTMHYKGDVLKKRSLELAVLMAGKEATYREERSVENRGRLVKSYEQEQEKKKKKSKRKRSAQEDRDDYESRQGAGEYDVEFDEDSPREHYAYDDVKEFLDETLPSSVKVEPEDVIVVCRRLEDSVELAAEYVSDRFDVDLDEMLDQLEAAREYLI